MRSFTIADYLEANLYEMSDYLFSIKETGDTHMQADWFLEYKMYKLEKFKSSLVLFHLVGYYQYWEIQILG